MAKVARFALNGVLDVAALLMVVMVADLTTRIAYSEAAVAMRVDAVTHCATARPVASERPRGGRCATATVEDRRSIGSRVPLTVPASGRHPVLATPFDPHDGHDRECESAEDEPRARRNGFDPEDVAEPRNEGRGTL